MFDFRKMEGDLKMSEPQLENTIHHWRELSAILRVPHTEDEYETLVTLLDKLIDIVGENESHPLASLMEVVGVLIEKYEDEHISQL
jgi:HTH-type transcriptional regulator/antitoxin HigA